MPKRLRMLRFVQLMVLLIVFVTVVACTALPSGPLPPTPIPTPTPRPPASPTATPLPTLSPSPSFTSPLPTPTSVPPTPQTGAEGTPLPPTVPPPVPTATPHGETRIEIQGPSPGLWPSYLPGALSLSQGMMDTEQGTRLFFGDPTGQWLIIDQSQAPADRSLPEGQRVQVKGQEAVLLTGQSGVEEWLGGPRGPREARMQRREVRYENAVRLIWYAGDTRIEMLSNLDGQEILRIAGSMG